MLVELDKNTWPPSLSTQTTLRLLNAIEEGKVIFLLSLNFDLFSNEKAFLTPHCIDPKSKNISFDPQTSVLKGAACSKEDIPQLCHMMTRFAHQARSLINSFFSYYQHELQWGKTSFRPTEILNRKVSSYRKDDTRIHVDAFASQPVQGRRLLRVFSNINPDGTLGFGV